jgi:hypothetical protein
MYVTLDGSRMLLYPMHPNLPVTKQKRVGFLLLSFSAKDKHVREMRRSVFC